MKNTRFFADYGMIMVLLLLCIFFSIVTHGEQSPTGEAAARQVLASISGQGGQSPRVLIAASDQPGDAGGDGAASLHHPLQPLYPCKSGDIR